GLDGRALEAGGAHGLVEEVPAHQREAGLLEQGRGVLLLEARVVEVVEVVDPDDLVAAGEQGGADVRSDEAGRAGDEVSSHVRSQRRRGPGQSRLAFGTASTMTSEGSSAA